MKFLFDACLSYRFADAFTNTAEGFFSLFKRGVVGAFHHVSAEHIHRYLSELDSRWNRRKDDDGTVFSTPFSTVRAGACSTGSRRARFHDGTTFVSIHN